jgi:hypothetical protein
MSELLNELNKMSDFIIDLWVEENDPDTRRGILQILIMIIDEIPGSVRYKRLNIESDDYQMALTTIKETETLITEYKQKSKIYDDLLDHVVDVINKVEKLFLPRESPAKPKPVNPSTNQKIQ